MLNNMSNNILEPFNYGFCNIKGELIQTNNNDEIKLDKLSIGLLKEVYPVISCMNNDIEGNQNGYNIIGECSQNNDIIINIRVLLYSEIELKNYNTFYEDNNGLNEHIRRLMAGLCNIADKELIDTSINEFQKFFYKNKIMDFKYNEEELLEYINKSCNAIKSSDLFGIRLNEIIKIFKVLLNVPVINNIGILWSVFILKLYSMNMDSVEQIKVNLDCQNNDEYLVNSIKRIYREIDESLLKEQVTNIKNMLSPDNYLKTNPENLLFFKINQDRSGNEWKKLFDILNNNDQLRKIYLEDTKDLCHRCFAVMKNKVVNNKRYVAVSGFYLKNDWLRLFEKSNVNIKNNIEILKSVLVDESYEIIEYSDEVNYYFKVNGNKHTIEAKKLMNLPDIEKNEKYNIGKRMFSCCERKLSTKFQRNNEYDIYVKYQPCTMCCRMIKEEEKDKNIFINLNYIKQNRDIKIKKFDKLALKAYMIMANN